MVNLSIVNTCFRVLNYQYSVIICLRVFENILFVFYSSRTSNLSMVPLLKSLLADRWHSQSVSKLKRCIYKKNSKSS